VIAEYMQFTIEKLDRKISMTNLIEYMKLHLISLIQDLDSLHSTDESYKFVLGQIEATKHIMSVATDIMNDTNERIYS